MYEKRNFHHDEKEYEIRVASDGHTIRIRAFLNGKPANGYTYSVELLTRVEFEKSSCLIDPVENLIKTAISDVKNGLYEKYLAMIPDAGCQSPE